MKEDNDLKSCLTSVILYFIGLGAILFCFFVLGIWNERHPVKYCDELKQDEIKEYSPKVCNLRYPILNIEDTNKIRKENEELKDKVLELEDKLDDIKDVMENEKEDNWEPDPPEIDF